MKKNKGFTLIELLVVISIISLLSSIVFTALNGAKIKAKDAALKQEVGEMQKVIEQRFLTGNYPDYFATGLLIGIVDTSCSNFLDDSEAKNICKAIYRIGPGFANDGNDLGSVGKFAIGFYEFDPGWQNPRFRNDMYSITIRLNSGNYYCLSNIGVYEGIVSWSANHPPCFYYVH